MNWPVNQLAANARRAEMMLMALRICSNLRAHRIQIHVLHAREDRRVIQNDLTFKATFQKRPVH